MVSVYELYINKLNVLWLGRDISVRSSMFGTNLPKLIYTTHVFVFPIVCVHTSCPLYLVSFHVCSIIHTSAMFPELE
jgi:hypothetical protein